MRARRRRELQDALFHSVDGPIELLDRCFDIDLAKGMAPDQLQFVRMMFQRRHVFEHEGGVATRRYLDESRDGSLEVGTLIRETRENAHKLAGYLDRIAINFETGFHEIFVHAATT